MNLQKKQRFTKAQVAEWARGRLDRMAENYGIKLDEGWYQVDQSTAYEAMHPLLERNRAMGEVMALQALLEVFEL
jgi:hypothetical protein